MSNNSKLVSNDAKLVAVDDYPPPKILMKYEIEEGRQDFEEYAMELMREKFEDYEKNERFFGEVLLIYLSSFILQ